MTVNPAQRRLSDTRSNGPADLSRYWLPFTNNKAFSQAPVLIDRAEGNHYLLTDGRRVLDAGAGLWCVNAGHGRKRISDAIAAQAAKLDYASSFGHSHPLVFEFAERLTDLAPGNLNHVFFTNSGSESVDTAMKIAMAYHLDRGEGQRTRFVGRQRAYHGVGFGGMSVAGLGGSRRQFGPMLAGISHLPHTWDASRRFVRGQSETGIDRADALEDILATQDPTTVAAVIIEPVAGSGGVLPPPKGYLERIRAICDRHGLLLVFDEVITGFGRLGKTFAADHFGVMPDIITCAKGMTNGAVPMGGVIVSGDIYDSMITRSPGGLELAHGYTYSGHPLAAAAGLATLEVHAEDDLNARALLLAAAIETGAHALAGHEHVTDVRNIGVLAALDIALRDGAPAVRASDVSRLCLERGVLVRATRDTILLSPPLTFTTAEVEQTFEVLSEVIAAVS